MVVAISGYSDSIADWRHPHRLVTARPATGQKSPLARRDQLHVREVGRDVLRRHPTLDLGIGAAITAAPTNAVPFTFSAPIFAPGTVIAAQAVALFDGAFPLANGETGGFVLSSGLLSTTQVQ